MRTFKEDFIELYRNERGIILLMIFNFLVAMGIFVFSIVKLNLFTY